MNKKQILKITSITLILALLTSIVSVIATAEGRNIINNKLYKEKPAYIIGEIESMRTKNEKFFKMSDGSIQTAIYNFAVHFKDENGKFQNINNNLKSINDDEYVTTNSKNSIVLSKNYKSGKTVEIKSDDVNISWGFVGTNITKAILEKKEENLNGDEKFTSLPNTVSTTIYKNIFNNIDAEYILNGEKIKENLILNNKTDLNEFEIEYRFKKLTPIQKDEKTIELKNKNNKIVYTITAPLMTDDNGITSDALTLTILSVKNNKMSVKLSANKEWLQDNERKFPVKIDPSVSLSETNMQIEVGSINQSGTKSDNNPYNSAIYLKLHNYHKLLSGAYITNAVIRMFYQNSFTGSLPIYSSDGQDFSWSHLDYKVVNDYADDIFTTTTNVGMAQWNVTKAFQQIAPFENLIFAVPSELENLYMDLGFNESESTFVIEPTMQLTYVIQSGIDSDKYSYHEFDMNEAGTVYLSDLTKDVIIRRNDISVSDDSCSVDIGMTYTYDFDHHIGSNENWYWKPYYTESVCYYPNNSENKYIYECDDGKAIFFSKSKTDDNGRTYYCDDDNEGYSLYNITENSLNYYKIITPNNKVLEFSKAGKKASTDNEKLLTKITNNGEDLSITYNSALNISKITDSKENEFKYNYDENKLKSVVCQSKNLRVDYTYQNANLVKVTTNKFTVNYDYTESNSNIKSIILPKNSKLEFNFTNSNTITEYGYNESTETWERGNRLVVTKYPFMTTYDQISLSDKITYTEKYYFNKNGYLESVINNNGFALNQAVDLKGKVIANTDITIPVVNLAKNNSFENGSNNWSLTNSTIETDTNAFIGNKLLKIDNTSINTSTAKQTISGLSAGTYTFSAYVKTASDSKVELSDNKTIYDGISVRTTAGNTTKKSTGIKGQYENWSRVYVTFDVAEDNSSAELELGLYNAKGKVYFDAIQLEKHKRAYEYNAINNADFSENSNWRLSSGASFATEAGKRGALDNNAIKLTGNKDQNVSAEQILNLTGAKDLSVSAWIKTVGMLPNESLFETRVAKFSVIGLNSSSQTVLAEKEIDFTLDSNNSFAGFRKVMFPINDIKTNYSSFKLLVEYNNQQGYMYVDGVEVMSGTMVKTSDESSEETSETSQEDYQIENGYSITSTINSFENYSGITGCSYLGNGTVVNNSNGEKDEELSTAYLNNSWCVSQSKDKYDYINPLGEEAIYPGISLPSSSIDKSKQSGIRFWYKSDDEFTVILRNTAISRPTVDYSETLPAAPKGAWKTILYKDIEKAGKDIANLNFIFIKTTSSPVYIDEIQTVLADAIIDSSNEYTDDEYNVTENISESRDGQQMKTISATKSITVGNIACTLSKETNSVGVDTFTTTENETGNQISATDGNGNTVNYSYDDLNNLIKMSQTVNETELDCQYTYSKGRISTITSDGVTYSYEYSPFGDLKSISVGRIKLIEYTYSPNDSRMINKITYANGQTIKYNYDSNWFLKEIVKDSINNTISYTYDEIGQTLKTIDSENKTVTLAYLDETQIWNKAETSLLYAYSSNENEFSENINGINYVTKYSSTDNSETTDLYTTETTEFGNTTKIVYKDAFGRIIKEEVKSGNAIVLLKEYVYNSNGDYITDQLNYVTTTSSSGSKERLRYTYDNNGNITGIYSKKDNADETTVATYQYDALGQLIKENNKNYTYDNHGNLTKKWITNLSYENSDWKDKLTKYGNQAITYDESGNPLSYLGATLTWKNGRQLSSYTKGNLSVTYKYNADGLRTEKNVVKNGVETNYKYTWSGNKLVHQVCGNENLHFYYDSNDEITGFSRDDGTKVTYYSYVKNIQGDIIEIIDENGNSIATYSYDAWGVFGDGSGNININPIRYRGYYYDNEIGMYYLQSRYYNPRTARFVNADDTDYIGYTETMLSYNIFAYCKNNSVNRLDNDGHWDYNVHGNWIKEKCLYYINKQPSFTITRSNMNALINWQKIADTEFGNNVNGNPTYKEPFHGKDNVEETLKVITELFNLAIATKNGNLKISNISFHKNPQTLSWSKLKKYNNGFISTNYIVLSKNLSCVIGAHGTSKGVINRNNLLIKKLKNGKQTEIFLALALHTAMDFFSHVVPVWYTTNIKSKKPKMLGPFKINSAVSINKAKQFRLDDNINSPVLFNWRITNTKSIIDNMIRYYGQKRPKRINNFYCSVKSKEIYQTITYNKRTVKYKTFEHKINFN